MFKQITFSDFRIFSNTTVEFGDTLTAIAGHNATGKSTILGVIGNSCEIKTKDGTTITDKQFNTEFSELFRGSKKFDKNSGNIGRITFCFPDSEIETNVGLRVTWQKWDKDSTDKNRFRILNNWIDPRSKKITAKKIPIPSFYLGLSRLYPLGEVNKEIIEEKKFHNKITKDDEQWIIQNYNSILSLNDTVNSISNYELIKKRSGGVNTDKYDYLSNSSGQDNLMQILYILLSFVKLKEEYQQAGKNWLGGTILIDEIDATLHPSAQIKLISLIYSISKNCEIQTIFTTHSLQILSYLCDLQNRNLGINIEYFTTANNILEVMHNPTYEAMENDMLISNFYLSNNNSKILVYSEDNEARWFIKKLLNEYRDRIRLVDIKLGGESLMDLLVNDPDYFKNVLFILDGDKVLSCPRYKDLPRRYCNVINLPGNLGPEETIYKYLISLEPHHSLLTNNFDKGLTIRAFKEMNPEVNTKYKGLTDKRDKYKMWFNDSLSMFDDIDVYRYWADDNPRLVEDFIQKFKNDYNILASRTRIPKLS